jgi:hypothetical protein
MDGATDDCGGLDQTAGSGVGIWVKPAVASPRTGTGSPGCGAARSTRSSRSLPPYRPRRTWPVGGSWRRLRLNRTYDRSSTNTSSHGQLSHPPERRPHQDGSIRLALYQGVHKGQPIHHTDCGIAAVVFLLGVVGGTAVGVTSPAARPLHRPSRGDRRRTDRRRWSEIARTATPAVARAADRHRHSGDRRQAPSRRRGRPPSRNGAAVGTEMTPLSAK